MAMTDQELKLALDSEEPQYQEIVAQLDESDVPRVRQFAESGDVALASKAVYLASLLKSEAAHEIVVRAAGSGNELVRVASATAIGNLPTSPRERAAGELIGDANPAMAKMVLRAVGPGSPAMKAKLQDLERRTAVPELKAMLRDTLGN
jgi:hypothetical protein